MVVATKTRKADKPLAPAAVISHWLVLPSAADMDSQVAIEDAKLATFYRLVAHLDQRTGEVMGYRLTKVDGTTYDLDPTGTWGWTCDCPDGLHRGNRPGGCRHAVAVRQLLASLDDALAAAEQARLEAEQAADREGEPFPWPTPEELRAMAVEAGEEAELGRSGLAFAEPEGFRFGVGA